MHRLVFWCLSLSVRSCTHLLDLLLSLAVEEDEMPECQSAAALLQGTGIRQREGKGEKGTEETESVCVCVCVCVTEK